MKDRKEYWKKKCWHTSCKELMKLWSTLTNPFATLSTIYLHHICSMPPNLRTQSIVKLVGFLFNQVNKAKNKKIQAHTCRIKVINFERMAKSHSPEASVAPHFHFRKQVLLLPLTLFSNLLLASPWLSSSLSSI